jgi:hypothetical protein
MKGGGEARADDPSDHAVSCLADLIDHMILETQKLFKGTDMEDRSLLFHDALAQWNEGEEQAYLEVKYPGGPLVVPRPMPAAPNRYLLDCDPGRCPRRRSLCIAGT